MGKNKGRGKGVTPQRLTRVCVFVRRACQKGKGLCGQPVVLAAGCGVLSCAWCPHSTVAVARSRTTHLAKSTRGISSTCSVSYTHTARDVCRESSSYSLAGCKIPRWLDA